MVQTMVIWLKCFVCVMKAFKNASQERLRLQAIEEYRSRKGWKSRPGSYLPPSVTSDTWISPTMLWSIHAEYPLHEQRRRNQHGSFVFPLRWVIFIHNQFLGSYGNYDLMTHTFVHGWSYLLQCNPCKANYWAMIR